MVPYNEEVENKLNLTIEEELGRRPRCDIDIDIDIAALFVYDRKPMKGDNTSTITR